MRTYSNRKVLKGIEGPSLENRKSIDGSHSRGNEKNREPKRLPMGCSGSQRGLKERKENFSLAEAPATGRNPFSLAEAPATAENPFRWRRSRLLAETLFAGGAAGYGQIWLRPRSPCLCPHTPSPCLCPHTPVSMPAPKPATQA